MFKVIYYLYIFFFVWLPNNIRSVNSSSLKSDEDDSSS